MDCQLPRDLNTRNATSLRPRDSVRETGLLTSGHQCLHASVQQSTCHSTTAWLASVLCFCLSGVFPTNMEEVDTLELNLEDIFMEDINWEEETAPAVEVHMKSITDCEKEALEMLKKMENFCFRDAANKFASQPDKVSEFAALLHTHLVSCIVTSSLVKGINLESSQANFFQLMSGGMHDLNHLSGNHQLTMWLSTNIFDGFYTKTCTSTHSDTTVTMISSAEEDVAHYIGGFVCCKLKQRSRDDVYKGVVSAVESEEDASPDTLVAAKSRGRLINLTKDGQSLFYELEYIFRCAFPSSVTNVSKDEYISKCVNSDIVQDCFHNATAAHDKRVSEKVLLDIISLYFKVRVHQKCKCVVENLRKQKSDSTKEKALRSKLSK